MPVKFTVVVRRDGVKAGEISITEMDRDPSGEMVDFSVQMSADMGGDVFIVSQKSVQGFPLNAINSIGLLKAALSKFDEHQLGMDDRHVNDCGGSDEDSKAGPPALER